MLGISLCDSGYSYLWRSDRVLKCAGYKKCGYNKDAHGDNGVICAMLSTRNKIHRVRNDKEAAAMRRLLHGHLHCLNVCVGPIAHSLCECGAHELHTLLVVAHHRLCIGCRPACPNLKAHRQKNKDIEGIAYRRVENVFKKNVDLIYKL